jgi:hypothetical protein
MVGDPVANLATYATARLNDRLTEAQENVLCNGMTIGNRKRARAGMMFEGRSSGERLKCNWFFWTDFDFEMFSGLLRVPRSLAICPV